MARRLVSSRIRRAKLSKPTKLTAGSRPFQSVNEAAIPAMLGRMTTSRYGTAAGSRNSQAPRSRLERVATLVLIGVGVGVARVSAACAVIRPKPGPTIAAATRLGLAFARHALCCDGQVCPSRHGPARPGADAGYIGRGSATSRDFVLSPAARPEALEESCG